MVTPRPLKLKREVARAGTSAIAAENPIARLWVDTGVFHLQGTYDYLIPEKFSADVQVGVRVEVEFGSSNHEAIVVERLAQSSSTTKLKPIAKVLSVHAVATEESLDLIRQCAKRWAGVPYDFIRSAIPPRVRNVDRDFLAMSQQPHNSARRREKKFRIIWSLPPHRSIGDLITELISKQSARNQFLIICSTERELEEISSALISHAPLRLDAGISRGERYRNFLHMAHGNAKIGIGLRGAIFTPLQSNSIIIVVSENSEHLYELRAPGWNARDVAILRSAYADLDLILMSSTPSIESARLIENGWLTAISSKRRMKVIAQDQSQGSLLPPKIFPIVRKALVTGSVLMLVPRKGYGNAVLCAKCRNIGLCECGGRLKVLSKNSGPVCTICAKKHAGWKCRYCQSSDIYLAARGIERYIEEIGRAFPNISIINSSGDHIVTNVDGSRGIVVATPGSEPHCEGGYAAVALLESGHFLTGSDLRTSERVREQFFSAAGKVSTDGTIFVALDTAHPLVASLARWDALPLIKREMQEYEQLQLPPFFRFISLEMEIKESRSLQSGINRSITDQRLPQSTVVRGPHEISDAFARITLASPISDAPAVVSFVHELQSRRSLSHKPLIRIRVDPYSLS